MGARSGRQRALALWMALQALRRALELLQGARLLHPLRELDDARHVLAVVGEGVGVQAVTKGDHKTRALSEGADT